MPKKSIDTPSVMGYCSLWVKELPLTKMCRVGVLGMESLPGIGGLFFVCLIGEFTYQPKIQKKCSKMVHVPTKLHSLRTGKRVAMCRL